MALNVEPKTDISSPFERNEVNLSIIVGDLDQGILLKECTQELD